MFLAFIKESIATNLSNELNTESIFKKGKLKKKQKQKQTKYEKHTMHAVYSCAILCFHWGVFPKGKIVQETLSCQ